MLKTQQGILEAVGNTPMVNLGVDGYRFMAKLEYMNPFGSMKDRAVSALLTQLLKCGTINQSTTIIESSSGNFAVALAGACAVLGLKSICVVDHNLTKSNQHILEQYGSKLIQVTTSKKDQSFQEKRIETVKRIIATQDNIYWTNQYDNQLIQEAYFPLAEEILDQFPQMECIYIPVSTCGTIAGVSSWIKKYKPEVEIIAVDSCGSQIFAERIGRNRFPGMGSRVKPKNLQRATVDKVVLVSDYECILNCKLLLKQGLFVGASSGAVVAAIKKVSERDKKIVAIFPDRGDRYLDNLFNEEWYQENLSQLLRDNQILANSVIQDNYK